MRRNDLAYSKSLNMAETRLYRQRNDLQDTEILRSLIDTISLTPNSKGKLDIELIGELAAILMLCSDDKPNTAAKDQSNGIYSVRLIAGA
jgi:hypothetical protein